MPSEKDETPIETKIHEFLGWLYVEWGVPAI